MPLFYTTNPQKRIQGEIAKDRISKIITREKAYGLSTTIPTIQTIVTFTWPDELTFELLWRLESDELTFELLWRVESDEGIFELLWRLESGELIFELLERS
jgi:hypothetical protein